MPQARGLPRSGAIPAPGQTGPGDGKRTNGKPQTARLEGRHETQRIKRHPGQTTARPRDTLATACPTGLQSVCNRFKREVRPLWVRVPFRLPVHRRRVEPRVLVLNLCEFAGA